MTTEQVINALTRVKIRAEGHNLQDDDTSEAFELAIKSLKGDCLFDRIDAMFKQSLAETQDAKTFCNEHMESEKVRAMYQFGLDHAGSASYLFAAMADFANSRINGK